MSGSATRNNSSSSCFAVDSHYHNDPSFGSQIFASDVQVIRHDNTRRRMLTNVMEQYTFLNSLQPAPAPVEALKERIAQEADPQQKAALERQIANSLAYLEQEVKVTPPNVGRHEVSRRIRLYPRRRDRSSGGAENPTTKISSRPSSLDW